MTLETPKSPAPSLSLHDRYRALAAGKRLQYLSGDGDWKDYDPLCHALNGASAWRVAPEETPSALYVANPATTHELAKLIVHCGCVPFNHLSGMLSQLSNICAGYVDQKRELEGHRGLRTSLIDIIILAKGCADASSSDGYLIDCTTSVIEEMERLRRESSIPRVRLSEDDQAAVARIITVLERVKQAAS
jgi:hypothetical protein